MYCRSAGFIDSQQERKMLSSISIEALRCRRNFPKLRLLELRNNDFAQIHPNVNQLSSLEVLDLSNNRIDQEAAVLLRDIDQVGRHCNSEKDAKLAQKLAQLQPFIGCCIPTGMYGPA